LPKASRKAAKRAARERWQTYEFWYRRKYNLTPRDPRFLELTLEEIQTDYWMHYFADNEGKGEEFEDEDLDVEALVAALEAGDDWEDMIND
jgi:hypothetical protein